MCWLSPDLKIKFYAYEKIKIKNKVTKKAPENISRYKNSNIRQLLF